MQHNRTPISNQNHKLVSLDDRDRSDLDRLLGKLRGRHLTTVEPPDSAGAADPDRASLAERAREMLDHRRKRVAVFGRSMFAEPAWEMLLILYASAGGQRHTQASLGELAGASRSTTSRWTDFLVAQGLVSREDHPTDKRTHFVNLSEKGGQLLDLYLSETG